MNDDSALTTVFVNRKATKRKLRKSRIVVEDGPEKGTRLDIASERVTIGRGVICDVTLSDTSVSGTHCEIIASETGFLLRDLGSSNGTWVAGVRVREAWLEPGMPIRVGRTVIRFEHGSGSVEIDLSGREQFYDLIGHGVRMREIFAVLEKVAASDLTVLVRGETGTGKELVARAIHRASKRVQRPLVVQDCSAIPANLIESILFGHERGSFTGAVARREGRFKQADGGTLFLDEVSEIPPSVQIKLLRFLQEREFERVGGNETVKVDVRVVAATNRNLKQRVEDGRFREDLYYRLKVVQLDVPPLRVRRSDIPLLAHAFLKKYADENDRAVQGLSEEALQHLMIYPWPGNVRELENAIERAVVMCEGNLIDREDLPTSAHGEMQNGSVMALIPGVTMSELERIAILRTLDAVDGSTARAAEILGISQRKIQYRVKEWGYQNSVLD